MLLNDITKSIDTPHVKGENTLYNTYVYQQGTILPREIIETSIEILGHG